MTHALITIDTELSAGRQAAGMSVDDNYACSFIGQVGEHDFGVGWLMRTMSAHGIRGVFMVDPMPGLVYGPEIVERMVQPILQGGHDVQLHIHSEWLEWAKESPVEGRTGRNIGDFSLADQIALIGWARDALIRAGAPAAHAFRAGNFGANDDTLRALAHLGLRWDSSFNADYTGRDCRITLSPALIDPIMAEGIAEAPVAGIFDRPGHFRPAQICALSNTEMVQALDHAAASGAHSFVTVTHSFEMLARDRKRHNRAVMNRCETLCRAIAANPRVTPAIFSDLSDPTPSPTAAAPGRLPPSHMRTWSRIAQQAWATWRYERPMPFL